MTLLKTRHIFALLAVLAITGCSMTPTASSISNPIAPVIPAGIRGSLHGGQQPVGGATIQLYSANLTGYGKAAAPLISSSIKSAADGSFTITNDYTCHTGDQLYIVATGGNPGVSGTQNNRALAMMTGLGDCSGLTPNTYIQINELTTVASVWALAPFMSDITHVATSATNTAGLANAFAAINEIVNTSTGFISGPKLPAGATLPINEIDTLADVLAVCVNSVDTATTQSDLCTNIFTAASTGSNTPTDTIQAAVNLAQHPTVGLALSNMTTGTAPYQPTLASAPTSWTIAISYTGFNAPGPIVASTDGSLWFASTASNAVYEVTPTAAANNFSNSFSVGSSGPLAAIAVDPTGNILLAGSNNSVIRLDPTGTPSGTFTGGGLANPKGIAVDAVGNIWVANEDTSSVSEFTSSGVPVSPTAFTGGGLSQPTAIAINPR